MWDIGAGLRKPKSTTQARRLDFKLGYFNSQAENASLWGNRKSPVHWILVNSEFVISPLLIDV